MVKARRNLAPVLGADRTTGHELDETGAYRLTFADVTTDRQAHEMPGSAGGEPARAVGACTAGKPPALGHANVWEGTACNTASQQGVQHQLRPCTCTVCNQ